MKTLTHLARKALALAPFRVASLDARRAAMARATLAALARPRQLGGTRP